MKSYYVESNGIRHSVNEFGTGKDWVALIPYFSQDFHVFTIDLRGHGSTDQPKSRYELATFSQDFKGVLDILRIKKTHLVGSSFGCDVALRFAYDFPDRVLSLSFSEGAMMNSTGPFGFYEETKEEHIRNYLAEPERIFDTWDDYYRYLEEVWQPWNEAKADNVRSTQLRRIENGKWAMPTKQETVVQIIDYLFDEAFENYFEKIKCPVLFLPAENELGLDIKRAFIEHVTPFLTHTETQIIPGTTHTMMFDEPEQMADAIKAFIKGV